MLPLIYADAFYRDIEELMVSRRIKMGVEKWTNITLFAEAYQRGYSVEADARGRLRVSSGKRQYSWIDGATSWNTVLAKRCTRLKEVTSRLLRSKGIHAPENAVFNPADVERALRWAEPIFPVVVKPSNANQGKGVHVGVRDADAFRRAFTVVGEGWGDVLVEEFSGGVEHRVLVVNGRVVAATRRVPAFVLGDGESNIEELAVAKSVNRGKIHKPLKIDNMVEKYLAERGLSLATVPAVGEEVALRRTSNLHTGGDAVDATDELTSQEREFVETASKAIPGLRLGGWDVLLPRHGDGDQPTVLEVNPSPMISMHHFPAVGESRDAAGAILDSMFER